MRFGLFFYPSSLSSSPFGYLYDWYFMHCALQQAQLAYKKDEVPIGAIIVDRNGIIIAQAYNSVERDNNQLSHAECKAITQAVKKIGDWRLQDCWLYVTVQPCMMCMGAILLSRFRGVIFATYSPLFGFGLDKVALSPVYNVNLLVVATGVATNEAQALIKEFFRKKRRSSERIKKGNKTSRKRATCT